MSNIMQNLQQQIDDTTYESQSLLASIFNSLTTTPEEKRDLLLRYHHSLDKEVSLRIVQCKLFIDLPVQDRDAWLVNHTYAEPTP